MFKGKKLKQAFIVNSNNLANIFSKNYYTTAPTDREFDMVFVKEDVVSMRSKIEPNKVVYFPVTSLQCWIFDDEILETEEPTVEKKKNVSK